MSKIRWLTEFARGRLAGLSDGEIEDIRSFLDKYEIGADFCEIVENGMLGWDDKNKKIFLRIKIFEDPKFWFDLPVGIDCLNKKGLLTVAAAVAGKYGLEVGKDSIFIEDEWRGNATAYQKMEMGQPNGEFRPYYYIGLSCGLAEFEASLGAVLKLIPKIESITKIVSIQCEMEELAKRRRKENHIKELVEVAAG